ncbi:coil containing protein [Vibrio phage 1.187.O._10N.286.49.F1]|nr:coil containing protein [Vibrio phage 1.187.O._10N.286.49.F1]
MDLQFIKKPEVDTIKVMDSLIQGVIATNDLIGIGVDTLDDVGREDLIKTYEKLLKEEAKELQVAVNTRDKVEFLDAVIDTLVVGCYYLILKKGSDYGELRIVNSSSAHVYTLVEEFIGYLEDEDFEPLYHVAAEIFFKLDVDHQKAVDTVLASNLSKFPTLKELNTAIHNYDQSGSCFDKEEVGYSIQDIEMRGRYSGVYCECVIDRDGVERKVFWATHDNGEEKIKYVKPLTFNEPDFASCWNF